LPVFLKRIAEKLIRKNNPSDRFVLEIHQFRSKNITVQRGRKTYTLTRFDTAKSLCTKSAPKRQKKAVYNAKNSAFFTVSPGN
jgi:hypothetical protein